MARQLTADQKAARQAARASRRTFAGTDDVGLLLALVALESRERTALELHDLADRPAAAVAAELRARGLELPDRADHGHDGRRRVIYALTEPDARAVAAWTRRRDRDARRPDADAQGNLFDAADATGAPASPVEPAQATHPARPAPAPAVAPAGAADTVIANDAGRLAA